MLIIFIFFVCRYYLFEDMIENNNILLLDYKKIDTHLNNDSNNQLTIVKPQNIQEFKTIDIVIIAMIILTGLLI